MRKIIITKLDQFMWPIKYALVGAATVAFLLSLGSILFDVNLTSQIENTGVVVGGVLAAIAKITQVL